MKPSLNPNRYDFQSTHQTSDASKLVQLIIHILCNICVDGTHLNCLTIVDINLANLTDNKVSSLGLNIVYFVLISVVKIYFDLIDLVVSWVGALKILIFWMLILARIDFIILPWIDFMVLT